MQQTIEDGSSVQHALKRTMGKLLGERLMSKQECCHLIMNLPTVTCSHTFVNVNLKNDTRRLLSAGSHEDNAEGPAQATSVTKMTLMDAYACRLDSTKWFDGEYFDVVKDDLVTMAFKIFAAHHCVGTRTNHRNKIKKHQKQKTVVVFTPRLSSNPSSPTYTDYCRYSLVKYVPWAGQSPSALWGGDDATEAEIRKAWEDHLQSYKDVT